MGRLVTWGGGSMAWGGWSLGEEVHGLGRLVTWGGGPWLGEVGHLGRRVHGLGRLVTVGWERFWRRAWWVERRAAALREEISW